MEQKINTPAPLSAIDTEQRLKQSLRHTYRRGILTVDALHCVVTALLLLALSLPVLSIAPGIPITGNDKKQNQHMITLLEQTFTLS